MKTNATIHDVAINDLKTRQDVADFKHCFHCYLRDVEPFGHDAVPSYENVETYWSDVFYPAIAHGLDCFKLARAGNLAVGAIFWHVTAGIDLRERTAVDHGCWVHPEWRRQGIVTALRESGLNRLRALGVQSLTTTILSSNKAGLASYAKLEPEAIGVLLKVKVS